MNETVMLLGLFDLMCRHLALSNYQFSFTKERGRYGLCISYIRKKQVKNIKKELKC